MNLCTAHGLNDFQPRGNFDGKKKSVKLRGLVKLLTNPLLNAVKRKSFKSTFSVLYISVFNVHFSAPGPFMPVEVATQSDKRLLHSADRGPSLL